jgi:5-methylcytosine-specific restriction endonuclease McrA
MSTPEARKRAQQMFHERHPEYRAEALRRYRERHPEAARDSTARYAAKPVVKAAKAARMKAWREADPERTRRYARDYQRRRRQVVVGDIREIQAWMRVVERDPCAYCGNPGGEVDHIVALATGGTHSVDNLTGACKSCNSGKHTADLLRFMLRKAA